MWLDNLSKRALGLTETRAAKTQPVVSNAPYSALSPMTWTTNKQPLYSDYGEADSIFTAERRNIYAYRCVQKISNSIAGLPYRAGDPISFSFNLDAPLARLLGPAPGSPNPIMSAAQLWRYSIAQYLILGKFVWMINRNPLGQIDGLYPLQAQHVHPIPLNRDSTGTAYYSGYRYGTPGMPGYIESMPVDNVVFVHNMSWGSPFLPQSPFQAAGITINIHTLIDAFDYGLMKNGGIPAGMMVTPPFATEEDRVAFRRQFQAEFGGASNSGKVQFAEREFDPGEDGTSSPDSVQWIPTATNPRDAQLSILRDQKVRDICTCFGVPLSMLGDSTLAKYTNMAQDRKNYWEHCSELFHDINDTVNIQLSPKLGTQVGWFDYRAIRELAPEPILPSGSEAVAQVDVLFLADEWRAERGLGPMPIVEKPEPAMVDVSAAASGSAITQSDEPVLPPVNTPAPAVMSRASIIELLADSNNITVRNRWVCQPGACEQCLAYEGRVDAIASEKYPDNVHKNCRCSREYFIDHREAPKAAFVRREQIPTNRIEPEAMITRQLSLLCNDMYKSTVDRLKGRRTKTDPLATDIFDQSYWEQRSLAMLSIFNLDDQELRTAVTDITSEVLSQLSGVLRLPTEEVLPAMNDIFDLGPERMLLRLTQSLREGLAQ